MGIQRDADVIKVSHGDGMGGSSINYGFSAAETERYLDAVVPELTTSSLSIMLLPGIGTVDHLDMVADCGAAVCRIATHVTEADVSAEPFEYVTNCSIEANGLLMLSHMAPAETVLEQAKLMEDYGATAVYVMDSVGAMLPSEFASGSVSSRKCCRSMSASTPTTTPGLRSVTC